MPERQTVAGHCPMGCGETLYLGAGGHVTCSWFRCPNPTASDELLHLSTEHIVVFGEDGWTLEHPARERVEGPPHRCEVHQALRALDGVPIRPGRYLVRLGEEGRLVYVPADDRSGTTAP